MDQAPFFILIAIAFGAMWLMSSRTRKMQREAGEFRNSLAVGQEVRTGSGMYGTVVDVDGDIITIESTPGNRSRWVRAAIGMLVVPPVEDEADDAEEDDVTLREDESDDTIVDVPDDLSSMPPAEDEGPDKK